MNAEKCMPLKEALTQKNVDNYLRHVDECYTVSERLAVVLVIIEACRYVMATVDSGSSEFLK